MKRVPINNGYYNYKSINNIIFNSKYTEASYDNFGTEGDILQIENKKYIVGVGKASLDKDKTGNEATKIFTLNTLCKFMKNISEETFNVFLTSPPMAYPAQKELLPKYLIGEYDVIYNGERKKIRINNVKVFPETIMTYIANNPQNFKRTVIVMDIGGVTTNVVRIKPGGVYNKSDIASFDKGMYNLEYTICDHFNTKYYDKLRLEPSDISFILKNGLYLSNSSTNLVNIEQKSIDSIINNHLEDIFYELKMKGWSISTSDVLITGGGGKTLYENIKENFLPDAILSKDPIFDNLRGLEIISRGGF